LAAREDNNTTPVQAAFGSLLILPGQFLDSPELPSEQFLEQISKTLSAAKHPSTRHNTAATRQPPPKLPDSLASASMVFIRRDRHDPPLQLLYDSPYAILRRSLHHFTLQIDDKEDKLSTLRLKHCSNPTALPAQPRARVRPPAVSFQDFSPPGTAGARKVHFALSQAQEPRREPLPLVQPAGGFARPAAIPQPATARLTCDPRAPDKLDL
jgi:hypothetical protein